MSRSNPYKLKPQKAKLTILAFGEGQTEKAFLKYLGSVYILRESGISIDYDYAGGKDPEYMISRVIRKKKAGDYSKIFILMDSDKEVSGKTKTKASKNKILIIYSNPCVEGLFLDILEEKSNSTSKNSQLCKREFESKYLNESDKMDEKKYEKIFNFDKLELARKKVKTIDDLVKILKNES